MIPRTIISNALVLTMATTPHNIIMSIPSDRESTLVRQHTRVVMTDGCHTDRNPGVRLGPIEGKNLTLDLETAVMKRVVVAGLEVSHRGKRNIPQAIALVPGQDRIPAHLRLEKRKRGGQLRPVLRFLTNLTEGILVREGSVTTLHLLL